jgi:hypothetical protein
MLIDAGLITNLLRRVQTAGHDHNVFPREKASYHPTPITP